jgi:plastocyanin domain-containing protein
VRFVITRSDGAACASGLRIPALRIEAQVPRGKPAEIVVTPQVAGVFPVTCVGEGVAGLLVVG